MRAASRWAVGANTPMHSTGSVVSAPMAALERPRSLEMVSTSGGTLAMTVRRLAATATRPRIITQRGGRWRRAEVIAAILPQSSPSPASGSGPGPSVVMDSGTYSLASS